MAVVKELKDHQDELDPADVMDHQEKEDQLVLQEPKETLVHLDLWVKVALEDEMVKQEKLEDVVMTANLAIVDQGDLLDQLAHVD